MQDLLRVCKFLLVSQEEIPLKFKILIYYKKTNFKTALLKLICILTEDILAIFTLFGTSMLLYFKRF